jgi:hypothetical protein
LPLNVHEHVFPKQLAVQLLPFPSLHCVKQLGEPPGPPPLVADPLPPPEQTIGACGTMPLHCDGPASMGGGGTPGSRAHESRFSAMAWQLGALVTPSAPHMMGVVSKQPTRFSRMGTHAGNFATNCSHEVTQVVCAQPNAAMRLQIESQVEGSGPVDPPAPEPMPAPARPVVVPMPAPAAPGSPLTLPPHPDDVTKCTHEARLRKRQAAFIPQVYRVFRGARATGAAR